MKITFAGDRWMWHLHEQLYLQRTIIICSNFYMFNSIKFGPSTSHYAFVFILCKVCSLARLRVLNLAHNRLVLLPPAISALSSLHSLNVSHNRLHSLPPEVRVNAHTLTIRTYAHAHTHTRTYWMILFPPDIGALSHYIVWKVSVITGGKYTFHACIGTHLHTHTPT